MGRILCAWSPGWRIANWRRRNPSDSQPSPFGLIETVRAVRRLGAVDEQAMRQGLYVTQKATDAMALVSGLTTAEAEPEADAAALEALADWCVRFSPAVALDAPDGLFLDIAGVSHLWGGEAAMLDDLLARLAENGLPFRGTVADTPGAAWALTHFGGDRIIAPPGGQAELLAPLPPQALRLDEAAAEQIGRLGLKHIGQLMDIPRGPLARRFGQAVLDRLDQALGRSREALTFRRPATPWFARIAFFEPISAPEDMARVAADICAKLCARLEAEGQGARRFDLAWHRVDGKAIPVSVGLARPGRDATRIAKLFAPKLDYVDPGFGIDVATLEAREVEPLSARQARLDAALEAAQHEGVAALVDRLANRLGEAGVWRAQAVESHVPERAVRRGPALSIAGGWDREAPRPLRLFRRPEPVEQVIALLPDDPPVRFRWRGRQHTVARAEGPERIGAEWWRDEIDDIRVGHVRDYYRVEDETGCRFWLFRAGLYEDAVPKWWLHGLFG
jgi:protein ImuB